MCLGLTPDSSVPRAGPPALLSPGRPADRRQRPKEQRRCGGVGPPSPDADAAPRLRRHGDQEKPKGKRQCKTKHIGLRARQRSSHPAEERPDPDPAPEQQGGGGPAYCARQPLGRIIPPGAGRRSHHRDRRLPTVGASRRFLFRSVASGGRRR
ncbi:hypothetical protein AAFF_G00072950 [Aldrovandia affinis]|uniref:BCL-6 corepressor non-ankyrin-repeat domain-containing protein n=1 Tax=Aldrovandia affinis TaxID=143900 RepID=A0AAD7WD10_9TELE|nr:hypothetical protein AAFF_G00072950 [Aldrovandia affinis]